MRNALTYLSILICTTWFWGCGNNNNNNENEVQIVPATHNTHYKESNTDAFEAQLKEMQEKSESDYAEMRETSDRIEQGEDVCYNNNTSSSRSSYSGGSTSYSSTTFNTSSEVMAYVSNRFRNSSGNTITIKYDGLYSNGNQITNAVRVVRFNGSRATLTATSPYTAGTLYFTVDASRGTFTDGSGDVFYIQ